MATNDIPYVVCISKPSSFGSRQIFFATPPEKRTINYHKKKGIQGSGPRKIRIPWLLWEIRVAPTGEDQLSVGIQYIYAMKYPPIKQDQHFYNMSIPNTTSIGSVCMGSVEYRDANGSIIPATSSVQAIINNAITTWWQSSFNDDLNHGKIPRMFWPWNEMEETIAERLRNVSADLFFPTPLMDPRFSGPCGLFDNLPKVIPFKEQLAKLEGAIDSVAVRAFMQRRNALIVRDGDN